ncbi:MAG: hypothetical protein FJX65_01510 [Alphaproteobacteria bacterium]|nr:hypothetical protein [Alphaproteobacteria bacterium]
MKLILTVFLGIAILAAIVSLFAGLFTMGGKHSNLLMRARIISQLSAVGLMALYFLLYGL